MSELPTETVAVGTKRVLPRVLGPTEALAVIVGSVIGSGIFIVPARVAREIPAMGPIVGAWVLGGLFSLCGALTLAEMGAMLPHAGGPYVYLKYAYGRLPAFLFGWTEFLVIRAGSVATLAAAFALYASQLVGPPTGWRPEIWQMTLATGAMAVVAVINVLGTKAGSGVQVVGTALKVGALASMIVLPFLLGQTNPANLTPVWPEKTGMNFWAAFAVAMVGILWAYDGWVNTTALAEEIRDPGRNIPRAMGMGVALLVTLYLSMTIVYHLVLPMGEIASAATEKGSPRVVAAVFCQKLLGQGGLVAISIVVMASTAISLNGNALSGPRAYFAMARDGLFPKALAQVHPRFGTPANAILAQSIWAIGLTVLGTLAAVVPPPGTNSGLPGWALQAWERLHREPLYDVMYSYVIFGGTTIYLLTIAGIFVLRLRHPEWPRPYRTWGYPVTPLVFIAAALLLLGSMLANNTFQSLAGLAVILAGIPVFLLFVRRSDTGRPTAPHLAEG